MANDNNCSQGIFTSTYFNLFIKITNRKHLKSWYENRVWSKIMTFRLDTVSIMLLLFLNTRATCTSINKEVKAILCSC